MTVALITSGAYVTDELAAEFGRIPPSFLPVGNQRLFTLQAEKLKPNAQRIILSIPETFPLRSYDDAKLRGLGIEVIQVPEGLLLGESIVYALNVAGVHDCRLDLLHGDTLITPPLPEGTDLYSIHPSQSAYKWATCTTNAIGEQKITTIYEDETADFLLSGYFSFSSSTALIQSLLKARGNFVGGLNQYAEQNGLSPTKPDGDWLDFGHTQTYYNSRWHVMTHRSFNEIQIDKNIVTKTSSNTSKLRAESAWFSSLPAEIKVFTPLFLGETLSDGRYAYRLGHEYIPAVSELFVFGRLGIGAWRRIFAACDEFLTACATAELETPTPRDFSSLYGPKAFQRLEQFCQSSGTNLHTSWKINNRSAPSLMRIVEELDQLVQRDSPPKVGIFHGDFCFSNILYDFRKGTIKAIDPRGSCDDATPSIVGDLKYDVAKLAHSALGLYDFIMADLFTCTSPSENEIDLQLPRDDLLKQIQSAFRERTFAAFSPTSIGIQASMGLLFLSMLPLHSDSPNKQRALLARGISIYLDIAHQSSADRALPHER